MIARLFLWKEIKKFPLFFILLLVTLLLGTLGLTGINIVSRQVQEKLKNNAKALLTSDLAVSARRELTAAEITAMNKIMDSVKAQSYQVIDVYSMINHLTSGQTRLVEIRAVENGFPFYGEIKLREGKFTTQGLLISKDLADLWNIKQGEMLKLGEHQEKVLGIVKEDSSTGLRGFSLAPRVFLPLSQMPDTGLLKPGATGSFAWHFLLKKNIKVTPSELKTKLHEVLKDPAVRVTLPEESSNQTGRIINTITNFMSLAALIGLILSLVGVFYLYQSHLVSRLKDLALFNLHGMTKRDIILGLILQFSLMFGLVFLLQFVIIIPAYRTLAPMLSLSLGLDLNGEVHYLSVFKQLPFLYGLSLFILVPLLMGLTRTPMGIQLKASKLSMGKFRFYDFIPFASLLWFFSCYLSDSYKIGNLFFASLLLVFLISTCLIKGIQWLLKKSLEGKGLLTPNLESGLALRSIIRSGHRLTLSFLSLAMGATLISLILQLDRMIQSEFALDDNKPGLFIFDIQEDQVDPLVSFANELHSPLEGVTPMIRARLELLNGRKFIRNKSSTNLSRSSEDDESRMRNNGMNLTYRGSLSPSEKIVKGSPFPRQIDDPNRPAYISLERRFAERMDIEIGDRLTFDVQGVEFEGIVRNFRDVKWTSFYPNFFVSIEPGFLDGAPKTFLAVLPAGLKEKKNDFQRAAVNKFPNISFIDVEDLTGKLAGLFNKSRQAVEIISWLSLSVGLVILYGLSHDQVYRRHYDLALLKTLGFTSGRLRLNLILEFGFVFLLAMSLGFFLGWAIAQVIGHEVFKLGLSVDWSRIFFPAMLLSILCLVTILVASWRAVMARPRELLSDS